eukprot:TRINITY_DN953_c0_g1_i1.p1 TRINITY_DN953_c0_g1~~TRINITY_DN953_c0_g1_i1.p1  ORF type:complete len:1234 (+),score=432.98 TRINITY_DN953_c0_g1_i1:296-3997(+)
MSDENPTVPKDEEFDKMFESDRFDPTSLNPHGTGNVDEGRNYYRSASMDEAEGRHDSEHGFSHQEGHFDEDFAHHAHSKHSAGKKKKSTDKSGKGKRPTDNYRPGVNLPTIPGGDQPDEETGTTESSVGSFPWKSKHDLPIVDTEHSTLSKHSDGLDTGSVFSAEKGETEKSEKKKAKFTLGEEEEQEDNEEDYSRHRQYRRPSSQHHGHHKKSEPYTRMGSQVGSSTTSSAVVQDDEENLRDPDIEDIGVHRFEKAAGMARHKITKTNTMMMEDSVQDFGRQEKATRSAGYGFQKDLDHTPHNLFVEMDELEQDEWVEKARWIKYEEDLEADAGRWGKPHVSSLSFRSLINVRKSLENGVMLLDLQEKDLPGVVHRVVEALSVEGIIEETQKPDLLRILNYRHKYVQPHHTNFRFGIKRSASQKSLPDSNSNVMSMNGLSKDKESVALDMEKDLKRTASANILKRSDSQEAALFARKQDILACLEEGTEGCLTLVGTHTIKKPICAFVRLGQSLIMNNTIEVNLPMRFIYILLTPEMDFRMDPHEIGRSFSTLMANNSFHNVCYGIEGKRELLHAINIFLDDSVVLPPGDWNKQKLLAMADIMDMRKRREERRQAALIAAESQVNLSGMAQPASTPVIQPKVEEREKKDDEKEEEKPIRNPLQKSPRFFGGLIDDIKYRYPLYWSDIKDGFDPQVLAATIFIYFAALSGAVAFGGLMGEKTNGDIGIPETLLLSSISGALFAMFAGCPLIIIGTTGPVLLFDESLYNFCESLEINFLHWRTWIGIWTFIISLIVAFFQGSVLVRFFSKFTKDIFAALISLLFIFEAFRKLSVIFSENPILITNQYCNETLQEEQEAEDPKYLPNVALLSTILMLGTFFIGYFLRIFRNSKVFGRNARRALGDFGVPIAIVLMVLLNYIFWDAQVATLKVPAEFGVTKPEERGWLISPVANVPVWAMFAGILPALLLFVLLFMETSICQLIMLDKTKGKKGVGVHLDIVILSGLNCLSSIFGGPWICAATVRAVSHVSALLVVSTNVVPGESPKVVGVRDQRLSAFTVSILLGLSVLMGPLLKLVPSAVLFGVFLYMGVSGMNGVQLFDRLKLFIMPVKHHPQVSYVKHVKTWRMFLYTFIQVIGLVILWVVKSSPAAIAFPFFVVAMVPLRKSLKFIFTPRELDMLDGPDAGKDAEKDDEEEDFYEAAGELPAVPNSATSLHRNILGIINMTGITIPRKKES